MYITRKEATETIYELVNSCILAEEMTDKLEEIAQCIEHENDNLFLWGAEDEVIDLFVGVRKDLITPEWDAKCQALYDKYRIREIKEEKA